MAEPGRVALVCGGTGLVGRALLARLDVDVRYASVLSLVRREMAPHGKIESRVVSFDDLDAVELPPVDDAFCTLGTTRKQAGSDEAFRKVDFDYVLAFARAAKRAGATRFQLVSSLRADPRSRTLYLRVKGEAESAVSALGFESVGIVRPSVLAGRREVSRPGEVVALAVGRVVAPFMMGSLRRYRPISARTVSAGLVHLAWKAPPGVTVLESEEIAKVGRG